MNINKKVKIGELKKINDYFKERKERQKQKLKNKHKRIKKEILEDIRK